MRSMRREELSICVGVLLACLGMALIGLGEWHSLDFSTGWLMYLGGVIFLLGGLFLLWKDPLTTFSSQQKPSLELNEVYLGRLNLNGYSIRACERENNQGVIQFRLTSIPALTPEKEAALIRYMINEDLIEEFWGGISQKIEEEGAWAFFQ
jgi:predicted membrane channel-forming protein YqfA (hemolysin III family)